MAALTWRNVTGASAGNPASALAGASSAFTNASRGALDLVDSLRKGEEIKRANATEAAIADIMASGRPLDAGHLAGLKNVDTSKVVDTITGARSRQAQTRANSALADQREYENTPEYRAYQQNIKDLELKAAQGDLAAREEANRLRGLEHQFRIDQYNLGLQNQQAATALDTAFGQELARRLDPARQSMETAIADVQASNLDPAVKAEKIRNLRNGFAGLSAQMQQETATGFLPAYRAQNPGVTQAAVDASGIGQLDAQLQARAQERSDKRLEADLDAQKARQDILRGIQGGSTKDLKNIGVDPNTGDLVTLDDEAASANTITQQEALDDILKRGTDFNRDDQVPEEFAKEIKRVHKQVGGNRELFRQVMANVEYDSEGFAGYGSAIFGAKDEVHNIPTESEVAEVVNDFRKRAGEALIAEIEASAPAAAADPATFFQKALEDARSK